MVVLSVHIPKTAGTSLAHIFKYNFYERLTLCYRNDPLNPASPSNFDPQRYLDAGEAVIAPAPEVEAVIHGHFHIGKYNKTRNAWRVTFLRHPVEILLSLYCFWKTIPKHGHVLHDYFVDENLTIVELAKIPIVSHLLSRSYFGGVDMERFDFIGSYEHRERDLTALAEILRINPMTRIWQNRTVELGADRRGAMREDRTLMVRLYDALRDDVKFYERYCKVG